MGKVVTLFVQHEKAGVVAVAVFGCGAVELLFGVEDLEGEDGESVDDEAGGLGVQRSGRRGVGGIEEDGVDLFGEVVAELVEAIDVVLDDGDGVVGGEGVAGFVFAMPEIEVGHVLTEDEGVEVVTGCGCGGRAVVTVEGGLILEANDVEGVEHAVL